jgi:hypothetical protein
LSDFSQSEKPEEPKKFKNPTTIEEMNAMRAQLTKDKNLKRRVKIEYKKKVQIEAQGMEYRPPEDLKQFKQLQPKGLQVEIVTGTEKNDTSTKDISDQVFVGEK